MSEGKIKLHTHNKNFFAFSKQKNFHHPPPPPPTNEVRVSEEVRARKEKTTKILPVKKILRRDSNK